MLFQKQFVVIFKSGHSQVVLSPDEYRAADDAAEASGYSTDQIKEILKLTPPSTLAASLLTGMLIAIIASGVVSSIAAMLGHGDATTFFIATILAIGFMLIIQLFDDLNLRRKGRIAQLEINE